LRWLRLWVYGLYLRLYGLYLRLYGLRRHWLYL
jgi:hypothetical protein